MQKGICRLGATSDYGRCPSYGLRRTSSTSWLLVADNIYIRRMGLMQSYIWHANKILLKRAKSLAYAARTSATQTEFQKTPTRSKLLSKFLHLEENVRQNDATAD